jgi:hypothetical protein
MPRPSNLLAVVARLGLSNRGHDISANNILASSSVYRSNRQVIEQAATDHSKLGALYSAVLFGDVFEWFVLRSTTKLGGLEPDKNVCMSIPKGLISNAGRERLVIAFAQVYSKSFNSV